MNKPEDAKMVANLIDTAYDEVNAMLDKYIALLEAVVKKGKGDSGKSS